MCGLVQGGINGFLRNQMDNEPKLILLADVIESKVRKEGELAYYEKELKKLQEKMLWIQRDIEVTNIIIDMVKHEKVLDVKERMENRMITGNTKDNV
jgi:hypothetical protein